MKEIVAAEKRLSVRSGREVCQRECTQINNRHFFNKNAQQTKTMEQKKHRPDIHIGRG